jgi:hypothetical protein
VRPNTDLTQRAEILAARFEALTDMLQKVPVVCDVHPVYWSRGTGVSKALSAFFFRVVRLNFDCPEDGGSKLPRHNGIYYEP